MLKLGHLCCLLKSHVYGGDKEIHKTYSNYKCVKENNLEKNFKGALGGSLNKGVAI